MLPKRIQHCSPYPDISADIKIKKVGDTREVNAKSIMAVMSLGVKKGNEVIITAEGEDEEDAIAEIQKVLEENL